MDGSQTEIEARLGIAKDAFINDITLLQHKFILLMRIQTQIAYQGYHTPDAPICACNILYHNLQMTFKKSN